MSKDKDHELLMFAAKALGFNVNYDESGRVYITRIGTDPEDSWRYWNPLIDTNDAFHLSTSLNMCVKISEGEKATYAYAGLLTQVYSPYGYEAWRDDKNAATRRAIVKAAAELGRTIK